MRITTWNCRRGFAGKRALLESFPSDLYVVQECSRADAPPGSAWVGADRAGVCVYTNLPDVKVTPLNWPATMQCKACGKDAPLSFFCPCRVSGIGRPFTLVGVWVNPARCACGRWGYGMTTFNYALHTQYRWHGDGLWVGDFNNNFPLDVRRTPYHAEFMVWLSGRGFSSLYHRHSREFMGEESRVTQRHPCWKKSRLHTDFIFGSTRFSENLAGFLMPDSPKWRKASDHVLMLAEFGVSAP